MSVAPAVRLGQTQPMEGRSEPLDAALREARGDARRYTVLIEVYEQLAQSEEDAADKLLKHGMSMEADEHLESATHLYRRAADVAQKAIDVQMRTFDLMNEDPGGSLE
jgi:uncharacterized membrane-anchored protein